MSTSRNVLGDLIRTARLAERQLARATETAGLTPAQFGVLSCLANEDDLSHTELARVIMVRRQSLRSLLSDMVDAGLIEPTGPRGRGRRNGLRITEDGTSAFHKARPAVARAHRPAALGLTAAERDVLDKLLDAVRDRLDDAI